VKQDERVPFAQALQRAREAAYAPGEYVEQETFMGAGEIRALAERAGIAPGVSVLDLCCGVAGPGRFITRELGCSYLGVDYSASAIDIARVRARGLACRFEVARVPPPPPGTFDVVLLLETMLAFPDKETLIHGISRALTVGGRLAFTLEEGLPLTESEQERMPDADTVWLTPLEEMRTVLERAGLIVRWQDDCSRSHRAMADSLLNAYAADATAIAARIGRQALDELLAAHRLWSEWLETGRVRKIAFVAEKPEPTSERFKRHPAPMEAREIATRPRPIRREVRDRDPPPNIRPVGGGLDRLRRCLGGASESASAQRSRTRLRPGRARARSGGEGEARRDPPSRAHQRPRSRVGRRCPRASSE
jgi:SAM-dependent methyltransferase